MKIAVCGPATLSMLEHCVSGSITSSGYPFPGTSELILEYLEAGHSVVLITTATDVKVTQVHTGENLEIRIVPARSRARSRALDFFRFERRGVADALRVSSPDVIHAHWTYEFAIPSRGSGVPSLVTVHDWGPAVAFHNRHLYWFFRAIMQVWCLLLPGQLSAPTAYLSQKVTRYYRRECHVIPNGVDLSGFSSPSQVRQTGCVGMLNVGFSERKNVKTALMAWKILQDQQMDVTLVLAGPGYENGGPAHLWALQNDCAKGVVFEGPLEPHERTEWYRDKTVFLHTSREESFGMVLIEAMAAKTPVIAGKSSGAVPEITRGAARLIDIDDASEIADHLVQLLGSKNQRERISALGYRVAMLYDKRAIAHRYIDLLAECVKDELGGSGR